MLDGLFAGQSPATYQRLSRVLDDAWDMFEAMGRRIAELTVGAAA